MPGLGDFMCNPRKIMLFDENDNENESVITQREDLANDGLVKNVFGIDLGTTNSAISIVRVGEPDIIQLENGKKTFPSCVMWKDGEFIVGDEAYNNKGKPNVQYSVKRLMEDASATVTFIDGDKKLTMTPAEVSAEVLKGIVRATSGIYGTVHDVVVTVPAYFNDIGKRNTILACELAGLNLIALENEPSAASLEYTLPANVSSEDVIVYDLGGGTFDVTLTRISRMSQSSFDAYNFGNAQPTGVSKVIKPLALGGDGKLGGDDIDSALLDILLNKVGVAREELTEVSTKTLISQLERIKKSGVNQIYEMTLIADLKDEEHISKVVNITPEDFVQSVIPIYNRTKAELDRVLAEQQNVASKILLVGGSTKNPIIQEFLHRDYGTFEISSALNPDLAVATGASIKGRILKYGDSSISSFDILPMTIGVLEGSSTIIPIIEKNEELPVSRTSNFTTQHDNQTEMRVAIYQGNSPHKGECVYLGDLIIDQIPKRKAGETRLSVTLMITANNVLMCEATVEGVTKTLQLSLNNDSITPAKSCTREEKRILRWREVARTLSGKKKERLTELLDGYPNTVSAEEITRFLQSIRGDMNGSDS